MSEADRRLSEESEQRFLDLYAHLLVYVNDRFEVIEEIETVADLEQHYTDELLPLRNTLYNESTTDLIEDFVEQNPPELSEADLEQVAAWTDFVAGEFVAVRYRADDAIFLDWTEPPKAYAVRPARLPFTEVWDESALPVPVSSVVLLPFEDQIVYDGWIGVKNIRARYAVEAYTTLPEDTDPLDKQRARYAALKAARDRALVFVLAYTAVRVGELLRDPNDPRRRGVRWEDLSLDDGSMDVYRKKQQWDAASLPDPVISPLRSYRQLMDPPTGRWPVFPTFDQRTLAGLVQDELADRGEHTEAIAERREEYARDLLLALDEDIRPPSITTDGTRSILQRLSEAAEIDIDHPKHDYLAPHGGRRGMGEVLVRAFGYTVAARYLDNSEEMVRERYSHIEAGELGDVATEALEEIDSIP